MHALLRSRVFVNNSGLECIVICGVILWEGYPESFGSVVDILEDCTALFSVSEATIVC